MADEEIAVLEYDCATGKSVRRVLEGDERAKEVADRAKRRSEFEAQQRKESDRDARRVQRLEEVQRASTVAALKEALSAYIEDERADRGHGGQGNSNAPGKTKAGG